MKVVGQEEVDIVYPRMEDPYLGEMHFACFCPSDDRSPVTVSSLTPPSVVYCLVLSVLSYHTLLLCLMALACAFSVSDITDGQVNKHRVLKCHDSWSPSLWRVFQTQGRFRESLHSQPWKVLLQETFSLLCMGVRL